MRIRFLFLLLLIPLFWTCKNDKTGYKPLISVSIEPLRNIVEHLAGDYYKVVTLTPVGASPETYEPTPKQLMDVSNSRLYFAIGIHRVRRNIPFGCKTRGPQRLYRPAHLDVA